MAKYHLFKKIKQVTCSAIKYAEAFAFNPSLLGSFPLKMITKRHVNKRHIRFPQINEIKTIDSENHRLMAEKQ